MGLNQRIMAVTVAGAVAIACAQNQSTTPEEKHIDEMVEQASTDNAKFDILFAAVIDGKSRNPDHYANLIDYIFRLNSYNIGEIANKIPTPEGKQLLLKAASQKALGIAKDNWIYYDPKFVGVNDRDGIRAWEWFNYAREFALEAGDQQGADLVYQTIMEGVLQKGGEFPSMSSFPSTSSLGLQNLLQYCDGLKEKRKRDCFNTTMRSAETAGDYNIAEQVATRLGDTNKAGFYRSMQTARRARDGLK